jgi:C_GCAxxG_C_C family probable redox protein
LDELIDIVTDYWKESHCAYAVAKSLIQVNNYSKDSLPILNALTAFGEGMGERSICGSVTGALASLGAILKDKMIQDEEIKEMIDKFKREFKRHNNSLYCNEILSPYLDNHEPYPEDPIRLPICTEAVKSAATIAQKIIRHSEVINQSN